MESDLASVVARLRRLGRDTGDVEVKSAVKELPRSLASTISAFANSHGGLVVLGLDERDDFRPAPDFDAARIADALKELIRPRRSNEVMGVLNPVPAVTIDIAEFESAQVVLAQVSELSPDMKPCYVTSQGVENGTYERLVDGDHRMGSAAIYLLTSNKSQPTNDLSVVPGARRDDLDAVLVAGLLERVRRTRPRLATVANDDEQMLRELRVLDRESGLPTLGGLLALGRYPQSFFPQLMISYLVFPTATRDQALGDIRMLDRASFEGPIPYVITDVLRRIESALPLRRMTLGSVSRDVSEIPMGAVREAVVNSVAHRDYSSYSVSEQVRVELFPNRLEISNPGGIWGGRTEREVLEGGSRSRNASLTRLLTDVPLESRDQTVSENAGTGLRFMIGAMKGQGLPVPRLVNSQISFRVSLARHGLLAPDVVAWLTEVGAGTMDERSRAVLALVSGSGEVNDQVVRYQLDMDSFDAWKLLASLEDAGWLKSAGRGSFAAGPRLSDQPLAGLAIDRPQATGTSAIPSGSDLNRELIELVRLRGEVSISELAIQMDETLPRLRNHLRYLVASGQLIATAPATSRKRTYRLPDGR